MSNPLKSFGNVVLIILGFSALMILLIFLIEGGVWLGTKILPWLAWALWIVLVIDFVVFLPMALFDKTKLVAAVALVISSYIYGLTVWLWGLIITYFTWGAIGVIIGLVIAGVGVVPMALLASLIGSHWATLIQLLLLVFFTFGSRVVGLRLAKENEQKEYHSLGYFEE